MALEDKLNQAKGALKENAGKINWGQKNWKQKVL